ncbi:MAG TPA: 16S rRNA (cytosine(967)-C(5))-methyltransferase RsmB [Candidatus Avimonas sp.]|jgi:16S rRNA (cytosine967-C5)-methyltransferase|nr:16S rRNA (cytosine(967)-C(5))-methyltransferase RsmB [Clostridiales bacterium]HOB35892.1 16S rRNA (cytosine(967)-C(5))-methyltransferase RsmB [Candidatus Avimonas sp.]HQA15376.1 16S rRNA (cytosine(967)-C(5))-methyltransferase RsmB [Candidatus Avimonas sp.]HQD37336.1 16S rRNA (cytosine(967)-C(5))-methyltransferase RsmB [Candidatus Avimonas sp.]
MPADARRLAVEALLRVHRDSGYSGAVLDGVLSRYEDRLSLRDQALLSRLYYGVLERRLTLDYVISEHSSVKLKKIHPVALELLRMGCYQLIFMDKIPAPAAVYESVRLAKSMGQERASGFINAVLRSIQRNRENLFDGLPDNLFGLSIRTSCPVELIELWAECYGVKNAEKLAVGSNAEPPATVRVNTLKMTAGDFEKLLEKEGIEYKKHPYLSSCYNIENIYRLKRLAEIQKNCYYHQDTASQLCCKALDPRPRERIADVCAAPGGKAITAAQLMENSGEILAFDIHPFKRDMIEERARQMGATIIRATVRDAASPCPEHLKASFDRVLCDVPCSGFGTIRRRPEIKYKPIESVAELPKLQYEILCSSSEMVRPGGVLQYSTCTLNKAENEQVAEKFLKEHPEFSPRTLPLDECFLQISANPSHQITLFPHIHNTDGFYMASFIRK